MRASRAAPRVSRQTGVNSPSRRAKPANPWLRLTVFRRLHQSRLGLRELAGDHAGETERLFGLVGGEAVLDPRSIRGGRPRGGVGPGYGAMGPCPAHPAMDFKKAVGEGDPKRW